MVKLDVIHRRCLPLLLISALTTPDSVAYFPIPSRISVAAEPSAFLPKSIPRHRTNDATILRSTTVDDETASATKKGMTGLVFRGSTAYTTEEVPRRSSSGKSVEDFFAVDENRNILLTGSGNVIEPMGADGATRDLMDRWTREAERLGSAPPGDGDAAVRVTTTGIQFPGLKVLSVATIGPRLVSSGEGAGEGGESPDPEYEFTLVSDEIQVEGPRPLRWIFRRLTEGGRTKDGKLKADEQTTHSLTRVRIKPADGEANGVVFTATAYLEIDVKFPSVLLKILPTSKEKTEEQGSASIQKVVEKDLGPSMEKFRDAYLTFLES
uniref:Uncharacterized protein n=1 Tax=Odontella aurita TaxID=265563 RepID=A0A7S4JNA5_9STRA